MFRMDYHALRQDWQQVDGHITGINSVESIQLRLLSVIANSLIDIAGNLNLIRQMTEIKTYPGEAAEARLYDAIPEEERTK